MPFVIINFFLADLAGVGSSVLIAVSPGKGRAPGSRTGTHSPFPRFPETCPLQINKTRPPPNWRGPHTVLFYSPTNLWASSTARSTALRMF